MNVLELFDRSLSEVILPDATRITAQEIARRGQRLATYLRHGGLQHGGLQPGDRVAVRLPNCLAYLDLLAACAAAQLVLVSVNTRYSDDEANDLIARSGASRVFDSTSIAEVLTAATKDGIELFSAAGPDAPFLVFTTSGTTSKPKMVRHQQRSLAVHGHDAANAFGYSPRDVALVVMPLCGTFGMSSLTAALAGHCTIVLADRFEADATGSLIAKHGITVVNGSDDMFYRLATAAGSTDSLRSIRLGGYARFNTSLDDVVERMESCGANITGLYGMSEVQALFSLRDPSVSPAQRTLAGGTLVSGRATYRIVDDELQLQGPSLFEGYLAEGGREIDASLTAKHFDDGWFRTGDAALAEDDRTFTYQTRIGDVLRLGGFLVAPADIESVLCELPEIAQAQVVSIDLPTGARPVAFVLAAAPIDEAAAMAHCAARMAKYKVPIRVITLDAFPVTPSANGNKIQRTKLRDLAQGLHR
jgi:fatty-acyl-CoA synthase